MLCACSTKKIPTPTGELNPLKQCQCGICQNQTGLYKKNYFFYKFLLCYGLHMVKASQITYRFYMEWNCRILRLVVSAVGTVQNVTLLLCCNCRKRKTPEACAQQPRIVQMVWDVDAESTNTIMKDMGVSFLAVAKQTTTDSGINTVPSCSAFQSLQPHVSHSFF